MKKFLLALLIGTSAHAQQAIEAKIFVQPLGPVPQEVLDTTIRSIEDNFHLHAVLLKEVPLPQSAWYAPRARHKADKLLDFLTKTEGDYLKIIGITVGDISHKNETHEDWGIFGLGSLDGAACVVSTFRLKARGADDKKMRERLVKIVIHEIGHTLNLEHCNTPRCVMNDAKGSIATVDAESGAFCETCATNISGYLRKNKATEK